MTTSLQGRALIESFEGLRLIAYQDQRGIWTIGYGHTNGVQSSDTCTQSQADEWLAEDLSVAEGAVNRLVTVPLLQNEFDALVSLCYNIGQGNFDHSTVHVRINQGDKMGAANAILMWDKVGGVVSNGLANRRRAERSLFLGSV